MEKKKLYIGIMVCCGLALLVDRCVMTDPATGPAAAEAFVHPVVGPASAPVSLPIPELPFPRGLKSLALNAEVRDLFEPPAAGPGNPDVADSDKREPDPTRSANYQGPQHDLFEEQHHLSGVMVNERLRIAIVDGVWLQLGQSLDDCKLISVEEREVRFECSDGIASLRMSGVTLPAND